MVSGKVMILSKIEMPKGKRMILEHSDGSGQTKDEPS